MSTSNDPQGDVRRVARVTSVVSAAMGVVLSPIPLADEILLVPVYGVMTVFIGRARGLGVTEVPWRPIASATVAALSVRAALNLAFAFVPGVAAVANAVSAAAMTRVLAAYVDGACQAPATVQPLSVQEITAALRRAARREPAPAAA